MCVCIEFLEPQKYNITTTDGQTEIKISVPKLVKNRKFEKEEAWLLFLCDSFFKIIALMSNFYTGEFRGHLKLLFSPSSFLILKNKRTHEHKK